METEIAMVLITDAIVLVPNAKLVVGAATCEGATLAQRSVAIAATLPPLSGTNLSFEDENKDVMKKSVRNRLYRLLASLIS